MVNRFGRPKKRQLSKPDNDLPGYVKAAVSLNRYQVVALKPPQTPHTLSKYQPAPYVRYPPSVIYPLPHMHKSLNVTTVTTTWTHIRSSPSIVITGSAILSIRCHVTENHVTMHHPLTSCDTWWIS